MRIGPTEARGTGKPGPDGLKNYVTLPEPELRNLRLRYQCDLARLPAGLRSRFVQLGRDASLAAYFDRAKRARHGRSMTLLHRFLRGYLSDFEINGLLGTYPMHVLGTEQWSTLLAMARGAEHHIVPRGRLLDVGAGSGDVTQKLAPLFTEVVTTELSRMMALRLRSRGFACHRVDLAEKPVPTGPYAAIACLNVLDRCDRPLSLLANLRAALDDGGFLILALVLPYEPFVYEGSRSREPIERLPLGVADWESSVAELCSRVIEPLGFQVAVFSRAPYLSGGDARQPLYELDDAILVCRAIGKAHVLDAR